MAEISTAEVLMTVTQENLETGLRGYPVGYCTTSSVDPQKGLFYVGKPLSEMSDWEPVRVIYLLFHGREGTEEQIQTFSENLQKRSKLSQDVIRHIQQLPRRAHPMKLFSIALLLLGGVEGTNDYREDALNIVAKVPELAATVINYHAGWGGTLPSKPELGYMENFAQMLNVPNANLEELTKVFKLFNVLHYDHGGGNLSAFTGKAVSSGLEDLYGSLVGAMCALAGPRHGKANQDSLEFVKSVEERLGADASLEQVENEIKRRLEMNELIFGFGHAVLRVEDPRATVLYKIGEERYGQHPLIKMASTLRKAGPNVLGSNPKVSNPFPNVDAISGAVLTAAGFPYPEYYTILFGVARCVGIGRQIVYERLEAREGKGVPIYRPKFFYKGA